MKDFLPPCDKMRPWLCSGKLLLLGNSILAKMLGENLCVGGRTGEGRLVRDIPLANIPRRVRDGHEQYHI